MTEPLLRPLGPDDAAAAVALIGIAVADAERRRGEDPQPLPEDRRELLAARVRRFTATDAPGCVAAEADGQLVGMAVAMRREHLWGLALLFVRPDRQSGGVGTRLLAAVRPYAEGARVEIIMASDDSRAIRRYASLGLALHPAVGVRGAVDRLELPAGLAVREGSATDLDLVDAVDRRLRGVPRTSDVAALLDDGSSLVVADRDGHRGFAVHQAGRVVLLGADDEPTARALLWECLARTTGEVEQWGWTASQGWAVDVALAARLRVVPGGPMFLRGLPAVPGPYLPSGVYF